MKNGIEIFFQNLGDADSIFVRTWKNDIPTNILIDGGYRKDADQVSTFVGERLLETGSDQIDHLVCSHCHDDHAGGVVELVNERHFRIGQAWVRDLRGDRSVLSLSRVSQLSMSQAKLVLEKLERSEKTRIELLEGLEKYYPDTIISEPFYGEEIGPLIVLGPTYEFFQQQYSKFDDRAFVTQLEARYQKRNQLAASSSTEKPLGDYVSPENEVSTILAYPFNEDGNEKVYMLTADAGREGLNDVIYRYGSALKNVRWLQVPHHGSRRNLDEQIIAKLAPETCFISCAGNIKHPSVKLVNKLKHYGTVYSTHYCVDSNSWLRQSAGKVFNLSITPATPLYEK